MAHDEKRIARWHLAEGGLKELRAAILAGCLDEVLVEGDDLEQLNRVEGFGFPIDPAYEEASVRGRSFAAASWASAPAGPRHPAKHRCLLLPWLSTSVLPVRQYTFNVSHEDVRRYGEHSGDLNPIHFDDDVARKYGFASRITHGMLFNGWFTRLLGMEFPGAGTIYQRSICVYLAPVYPNVPYRVRVSTPRHDPVRGSYRIVAQLLSAEGIHATVAYADVLNRGSR